MVAGAAHAADCGEWDAGVAASPHSAIGSAALTLTWDAAPGACENDTEDDWPGVDHYALYRRAGSVYSGSCTDNTTSFASSAATGGESIGTAVSPKHDVVHRSMKDFRYQVVACADGACSQVYGDGDNETVTGDEGYACTDQEIWVVEGIDDLDESSWTDTDLDWVVQPASASAAAFYPAGFVDSSSNSLEDVLGFWWSASCNGGKEDCVYYNVVDGSTGPQDWNDPTSYSWVTAMSTPPDYVLEETGGYYGFSSLSHPWVAAGDVSGTQSMWLYTRRSTGDSTGNHTVGVESLDEQGSEFGLYCDVSGGCDADGDTCAEGDICDFEDESGDTGDPGAEISICADATSDCDYLSGARHGRIMFGYVSNGAIDWSTDTPSMIFTGSPDGTTCPKIEGDQDDLYRAVWNPSGSTWDVVVNGSGCPVAQGGSYDGKNGDQHDPGVMPLPGGAFKMYAERGQGTLLVSYWSPSAGWEDATVLRVVLDDGSPGSRTVVNDCVDNMDVVVWAGPPPVEAMFFKAVEDDATNDCFVADGGTPGILYARHEN